MYDIKPKKAFIEVLIAIPFMLFASALFSFFFIAILNEKRYITAIILFIALFVPLYILYEIIKKSIKEYKRLTKLNETGKLVKCLEYKVLSYSGESKKGIIAIEYITDKGEKKTLSKVLNGKTYDKDGYVDMIIDKEDPKNNIIELEINRIGGNRKEDYYVEIYDELIKK